ncbi:hypothetical protein [Hymenobacter oligotrophus]|uniref:hypothetical protein n=1 Tax=Hymenobacter oligotrophus TaxID=2319843 RepID=UPI0019690945|nr:hypothetical protein [Hymenobacter oligotrophus]
MIDNPQGFIKWYGVFAALFMASCGKQGQQGDTGKHTFGKRTAESTMLTDTAGAYKLSSGWLKPKKSFEFNDSAWVSADTLFLVTCAEFVYYPFGNIKDESMLGKSLLKGFKVNKQVTRLRDGEASTYHSLIKGKDRLLLFFAKDDSPDSYWGSYIIKGELRDSTVALTNKVKVGMSANQFYSTFLTAIDAGLQQKIKFVVLEPCIDNPRHIYELSEGKLESIRFDCLACDKEVDY